MEVVQPEHEVLVVSKSVSLAFEGFDFVVDAFDHGTGDGVFEVVEQAGSISSDGLGNLDKLFDSRLERIPTPSFEECFCSVPILFVPEEPESKKHRLLEGNTSLLWLRRHLLD